MRLQGVPNNYGVQQSSTSYNPYYSSQSSPPTSSYAHHPNFMVIFFFLELLFILGWNWNLIKIPFVTLNLLKIPLFCNSKLAVARFETYDFKKKIILLYHRCYKFS